MARQFEKGNGETFPDITRFTQLAPEPDDEQEAESHAAAAYAASCENALNNTNSDALKRGTPDKQQNIEQAAEKM